MVSSKENMDNVEPKWCGIIEVNEKTDTWPSSYKNVLSGNGQPPFE
jgi:hypothetical protein